MSNTIAILLRSLTVVVWSSVFHTAIAAEVNADPVTHQHTSNLVVVFTITMTGQQDTFTAPAQVSLYAPDGTLIQNLGSATLFAQRITVGATPPVAHS